MTTSVNCCPRIAKQATVIAIVVNNILLLAVFISIVWPRHTKTSSSDYENSTERNDLQDAIPNRYCFRQDVQLCKEKRYEVKTYGNDTVCCGNTAQIIVDILSEKLSAQLREDVSKAKELQRIQQYIRQLRNDSSAAYLRPAAHVGILPNGNLTGPDSEAPRVQWEESGERSFVSGGLIHAGDRLRVTKAGYYYVYTGLQFTVDPRIKQLGAIVAYVYRSVNGTKESSRKLMTSRESSCDRTRGEVVGPVSTYMAGTFLLRDQDEVSVRTSSQSMLVRSSATTYLGMHMV